MKSEVSTVDGVLVKLSKGSMFKFVAHRGYDRLLCNHVYYGFCQNCPQYKCGRRRL